MGHNGIYWKECHGVPKNFQSTCRGGQGVRCALHRSKITTNDSTERTQENSSEHDSKKLEKLLLFVTRVCNDTIAFLLC